MQRKRSATFRHICLTSLAAAASMLPVAGCGPSRPATIPVRGTVTLDGEPAAGAQVMLIPEDGGRPAEGTTDDSGRFNLRTFEASDGAQPGRHSVTVVSRRISGVNADADGLEGDVAPGGVKVEWLIPQRYSNPKSSGLTAEVAKGMEPLTLELQSR
ncbi:MAG: carboxypeptidase-like regulatory domain-containing protein [Patescibacteria group bacterium]|nr:carboxypeptidase-like regulatory domain-containing protein [Patescibacteria group bacterium]